MKIKRNKIIEATEAELMGHYLKEGYDDLYSFREYLRLMVEAGVKIVDDNMKTLSVKQPWAYLLCSGIKNIENRTWKLPEKYRDEWVLIHASTDRKLNLSALTREQYNDACDKFYWNGAMKPVDQWNRSAIIGAVKFTDCVINHPSIWAEKSEGVMVGHTFVYKEGKKPTYNWVASDAILFDKPILNVKGRLGFWDFDLPEEYCKLLK